MGSISQAKVGLVTGGASGMGLDVAEHLVSKGWNIAIADFDVTLGESVASRLGSQVLFVKTNVINYDEQVAVFAATYKKWGQIDFVFANAGIGGKGDFYAREEEVEGTGGPPKPNTLVMDVCATGVIYSSYLALHFFRKNKEGRGYLVMTASAAGLYPSGQIPLYGMAKHGVVGLTRSMAQHLKSAKEPISVNCVCPGVVPTRLMPQAWLDAMPSDMITPTSTVVKAIDGFLAHQSITGQVAECSGQEVIYRDPPPPGNDVAAFMLGGTWATKMDIKSLIDHTKVRNAYYDKMEEDLAQSGTYGH